MSRVPAGIDRSSTCLIEIHDRLPVAALDLAVLPHADLAEVSGMELVEIRSVVVLTTCHTASTGMLSVFAYSSVTS